MTASAAASFEYVVDSLNVSNACHSPDEIDAVRFNALFS